VFTGARNTLPVFTTRVCGPYSQVLGTHYPILDTARVHGWSRGLVRPLVRPAFGKKAISANDTIGTFGLKMPIHATTLEVFFGDLTP